MTHTSCPSSLTVKAGLSFQGTLPLVDTGRDHVRPWSTDLENTVFQPSIQIAYTSPLSGTTSMMGSAYHGEPAQRHTGRAFDQVLPPSRERSIMIAAPGQRGQTGEPNLVTAM